MVKMIRSLITIVALAMFLLDQCQRCEGLVFVSRSDKTALLQPSSSSVMLYAHSQPMQETAVEPRNSVLNTDKAELDGDDLMAALRKEMLDLVYERSMQRFLE